MCTDQSIPAPSMEMETSSAPMRFEVANLQEKAALKSFDLGTRSEQRGDIERFWQSSSIEENGDEGKVCPREQLKRERHVSLLNDRQNQRERGIIAPGGAASKDVRDYKLPTLVTKQYQDCKHEAVKRLELLCDMRRDRRKAPATVMKHEKSTIRTMP